MSIGDIALTIIEMSAKPKFAIICNTYKFPWMGATHPNYNLEYIRSDLNENEFARKIESLAAEPVAAFIIMNSTIVNEERFRILKKTGKPVWYYDTRGVSHHLPRYMKGIMGAACVNTEIGGRSAYLRGFDIIAEKLSIGNPAFHVGFVAPCSHIIDPNDCITGFYSNEHGYVIDISINDDDEGFAGNRDAVKFQALMIHEHNTLTESQWQEVQNTGLPVAWLVSHKGASPPTDKGVRFLCTIPVQIGEDNLKAELIRAADITWTALTTSA